jgi:hypothetical protein
MNDWESDRKELVEELKFHEDESRRLYMKLERLSSEVIITETGKKYHRDLRPRCPGLNSNTSGFSRRPCGEVERKGYHPCTVCHPRMGS